MAVGYERKSAMQIATLIVPSSLDSLSKISDFVVSSARATGLDDHSVWEVQLAVDEAATNIIVHAYGDHGLEGPITVQTELSEDEFIVCLNDRGAPFDPDAVPRPDLTSPVEDRATGGLGLYLMRTLMDRVNFHFDAGGSNVLKMGKRMPASNLRFVRLSGRIDAAAAPGVQKTVRAAADKDARHVVIDLSEVTFLSSSGLRILLLLARELRKQGGDLRLCAARPQVAEVFHLTGFDQIFELFPSRESAVESIPRA
jgi:anti-anti-sigma factor